MSVEEQEEHSYKSFLSERWQQQGSKDVEQEFAPNSRLGAVYLENDELRLVTEIAILTGRPLLLLGEPGSGKSSFAPFIAANLDWKYFEFNVTGRTEARELLWRFDALSRLRDAQTGVKKLKPEHYVIPEVLWWAFNFEDALEFVRKNSRLSLSGVDGVVPFADINLKRRAPGAVVLIDEIDKADPNVPNDLLEVIGKNTFTVSDIGRIVQRQPSPLKTEPVAPDDYGDLLIIITTNEERDLPPAFMRRCIMYKLSEPEDRKALTDKWFDIARLHLEKAIGLHPQGEEMVRKLADKCWKLRDESDNKVRRTPSVAEFLDALKTCLRLKIEPDSEHWQQIERSVLLKKK